MPAQDGGLCAMPPLACPVQPPADGAPCCFSSPLVAACSYGCGTVHFRDGGSDTQVVLSATCDGSRWHVVYDMCEDRDAGTDGIPIPIRDTGPDLTFDDGSPTFDGGHVEP